MLDLLAHVVEKDLLKRRGIAVVCALAIPIDRFQFLDERGDRLMKRDGLLGEPLAWCMQSFAGHGCSSSICATGNILAEPPETIERYGRLLRGRRSGGLLAARRWRGGFPVFGRRGIRFLIPGRGGRRVLV